MKAFVTGEILFLAFSLRLANLHYCITQHDALHSNSVNCIFMYLELHVTLMARAQSRNNGVATSGTTGSCPLEYGGLIGKVTYTLHLHIFLAFYTTLKRFTRTAVVLEK